MKEIVDGATSEDAAIPGFPQQRTTSRPVRCCSVLLGFKTVRSQQLSSRRTEKISAQDTKHLTEALHENSPASLSVIVTQNDFVLRRRLIPWAWKLFLLLSRMLLFRPVRGGLVPRTQGGVEVQTIPGVRLDFLVVRECGSLRKRLIPATPDGESGTSRMRPRGSQGAMARVQVGEFSAARQAREGGSLAPGKLATLAELTNPERRPPGPKQPINGDILRVVPKEEFRLDPDAFLIGLRKAWRGAAAGPSGMTSDHLFPIFEVKRVRSSWFRLELCFRLATYQNQF